MSKKRCLWAITCALCALPALPGYGQTREPDFTLDAATRDATVRRTADQVEKYYFNEQLAKQMAAHLRSRLAGGSYGAIFSAAALGEAVTADLRSVSRDGHVSLQWSARPLPGSNPDQPPPPPPPDAIREQQRLMTMLNGFVTDAVWLPGNVGYLSLDAFGDPASVAKALSHAMSLIGNTDALIIDMRTNKGGSPAAVALLASYFFDETHVHLNDLVNPRTNQTQQFFTLRDLDGPRYGVTRPVYILTSKSTFSAPEELAYDLQALRRATIVGEVTGGGANPAAGFPVNDHFFVAVPIAEARNPVTGRNWEGVGVQPDVVVRADAARDAAYLLALIELRERVDTPAFVRQQISDTIQRLLGRLAPAEAEAIRARANSPR